MREPPELRLRLPLRRLRPRLRLELRRRVVVAVDFLDAFLERLRLRLPRRVEATALLSLAWKDRSRLFEDRRLLLPEDPDAGRLIWVEQSVPVIRTGWIQMPRYLQMIAGQVSST